MELKNEPGQLARLGRDLAAADINIDYAYGCLSQSAKSCVL